MAEKRTCPSCGMVWVSADTLGTWRCDKCGAEIPPPKDVQPSLKIAAAPKFKLICNAE